jgi:Rad3-related DNA helicase
VLLNDLAIEIQRLTQMGQSLVCYPSKATMNEIVKYMSDSYKGNVLIENEQLSFEGIQTYVEENSTGSTHVVCGGRFVEGLEFSDENGSSLIKQAIIVGVPFNPPSEHTEQLQAYYAKKFQWNQWQCMEAFMYSIVYIKVRQAMGRTVRNLTDRANIVFLDSRYQNSKMLRKALKL